MDTIKDNESVFCWGVSTISFGAFFLLGEVIQLALTPKCVSASSALEWKNISVSFVHSVLIGTWAILW